jgi:hypothetical protein
VDQSKKQGSTLRGRGAQYQAVDYRNKQESTVIGRETHYQEGSTVTGGGAQ